MIVTTNLTVDDLEEQIGERTVSRLAEMCDGGAVCTAANRRYAA